MNKQTPKERLTDEIKRSGLTKRKWYRRIYLKSLHWKRLKIRFFFFLGQKKCFMCGSVKRIQVHHLNYRSIYDVRLSDLQALCKRCHKKEHRKKK